MILIHFFFTPYIFSRYRVDYFIKTSTVNIMTRCEYKYEVNQIKLHCIYFGFFICSSNRNIFHLTILIFHHFSIYSSPNFRYVLSSATSFYISRRQNTAYCVMSHYIISLSTSLSSLYLQSPRFCFSDGNSWRWRGDTLSWCNHSQFTIITKTYVL